MRKSSLEAHEAVKPQKESHYSIIKDVMRKLERPEIGKAIAYHSSLSYHQVMRRLGEMEKKGLVKVVGRCAHVVNKPLLWQLV